MTWFDALLGKIRNAGAELELGNGLNFTGSLRAAVNAVTGFVDVTLADTVSLARATMNGLVLTPSAPCIISGGSVSVPGGYSIVDTEGSASSDNLDTISTSYGGVEHAEGTVLVISQASDVRDVTITNGVGNIKTWTGRSIALTSTPGVALFVYRAGGWRCVGAFSNALSASLPLLALDVEGTASFGAIKLGRGSTLVIAGGAITVTNSMHAVLNEGSAALDQLDTINGLGTDYVLYLAQSSASQDIQITHGVGNIRTYTGDTVSLTNNGVAVFLKFGTVWNLVASVT